MSGVWNSDGVLVYPYTIIEHGAVIGVGSKIESFTFVEKGAAIGKRCTIKPGVYVWNGVTIGDDVFVGPNVTFTNDRRPRVGRACPVETTRVESGASIGAGAVILSGVVIGAGAMVGAGAVVTYSVPSGVTVVGNPAEARHAVVETVDERCSQAYGFTVDGRPFAHVSHCGCGAHKVAR